MARRVRALARRGDDLEGIVFILGLIRRFVLLRGTFSETAGTGFGSESSLLYMGRCLMLARFETNRLLIEYLSRKNFTVGFG